MGDDDILYHYTSAAGLIGLLGTPSSRATMWLTQIQYMNDHAEFYHAFELVREEVLKLARECPGVRRVISGLFGIPHLDQQMSLPPIKGSVMHRLHSFSLTERPDQLSQWRGYTPEGGYCVGFRFRDLKALADRNQFQLIRCVYSDAEKRSSIAEEIRRIEAALQRGDVDMSMKYLDHLVGADRADATAQVKIQKFAYSKAPYFKHHSFEEEQEWRIVGMVGARDARAKWRARESAIIPYCELDVSAGGPHPLPPAEVIVGPGLDFDLSYHAIETMKFETSSQFQIKASVSTLRR